VPAFLQLIHIKVIKKNSPFWYMKQSKFFHPIIVNNFTTRQQQQNIKIPRQRFACEPCVNLEDGKVFSHTYFLAKSACFMLQGNDQCYLRYLVLYHLARSHKYCTPISYTIFTSEFFMPDNSFIRMITISQL
jgi:hypothetical protein